MEKVLHCSLTKTGIYSLQLQTKHYFFKAMIKKCFWQMVIKKWLSANFFMLGKIKNNVMQKQVKMFVFFACVSIATSGCHTSWNPREDSWQSEADGGVETSCGCIKGEHMLKLFFFKKKPFSTFVQEENAFLSTISSNSNHGSFKSFRSVVSVSGN